ncbi:hypothetical protein AGMMS49944_06650 [Spirochaetia bacterium]|nr:hypothetical protein AGMMS49944_06650 [Spirochaetia bacterium]
MKKAFAIMLVATVMSTAAFAEGFLSAGLTVNPNFGGMTDPDLKEITYAGFGFGAYFDAKYVAVNLGLNIVDSYLDGEKNTVYSPSTYFTIGLLGKYPIAIGEKFSIAPAVGFEYQVFLSNGLWSRSDYEDMGASASDIAEQYDNFVIKVGALADFTIVGGLYARAGVLLDIGLPHKDSDPADTRFGAEIPIGIGYRF